jgi:hypothetical protein
MARTEVLRVGTWLYDGSVSCRVRIVRRDWDYYCENGYDTDPPDLGPDGWAYYVEFESPAAFGVFGQPSKTCFSQTDAIALAENSAPGIRWLSEVPGEA